MQNSRKNSVVNIHMENLCSQKNGVHHDSLPTQIFNWGEGATMIFFNWGGGVMCIL